MSNSSTNLDLISVAQAQKETTANALFDAGSPAMLYGRRAQTSGGLVWGYYGGTAAVAGIPTQIANGTVVLTASATNYIEADPATGAVSANATGFTAGRTRLYSVVAGTTTVTSYTDLRTGGGGGVTSVSASNGVRTVTGSAITAADTIEGDLPINAQTGTSYAVVTDDRGKAVTFNNPGAIAVTIAAAGSAGFPSGWYAELVNLGNGVVTLTPATSTVDGAASITLSVHDNICLFSDGANYFTLRGRISGAGSGTVTSVALSTPGVLYSVSGSPVTSSGTLALSLISQAVNSVLAGPASGGSGAPSFRALGIGDLSFADADATLAANSDTRLPTQKAVKAYVDNVVTGGAAGVMIFKGVIDASANPNYPAASAGAVYKVSVAGRLGGASGVVVEVGDTAYCTATAASGDQATVGSSWNVAQENIDGSVTGPASSTDNHVALFSGSAGKIIKDSGLTLAGTNTGDETVTTTGALISGATAKATPVDADAVGLMDSAASNVLKKLSWAGIKAALKAYFDTLYASVGSSSVANAQIFTSSGTWTKPAGVTFVRVICIGAGGGGGGGVGGAASTVRAGGCGGGGGAITERVFKASDLGTTETITIGAGGNAGTAGSSGVGTAGTAGGDSSFGGWQTGFGGGFGAAGAVAAGRSGGGGGGSSGAGQNGSTTNSTGGSPAFTAGANGAGGQGGGSSASAAPGFAEYGGGGGGGTTSAGTTLNGGGSLYAGGGGGGGGGVGSGNVSVAGGTGGAAGNAVGAQGGAAGNTSGSNGGAGATGTASVCGQGGGGGGCNAAGTAGNGGVGGTPGGGGGGGGGGTTVGGAGGAGGRGEVRVYAW